MTKRYLAGLTFIILLLSIFVSYSSATISINNAKGLHSFNFEESGDFVSEGFFSIRNTGTESTTVSISVIQGLDPVDTNDGQPRIHPSISDTIFFYPLQNPEWITLSETEKNLAPGEEYTFYYTVNIPKPDAWKSIGGSVEKGFLNYILVTEKDSSMVGIHYNYKLFIAFAGEYSTFVFTNVLLLLLISSIASIIIFFLLKFKKKKQLKKEALLPLLIAFILILVPLVQSLTLTGTFYVLSGQMDPPTSFTATAYNTTVINLSWVKNLSADKTYILRNATGWSNYPANVDNGTFLYNGTNTTFNDSLLVKGTAYYYAAWSWNETTKNYSNDNATAMATTKLDVEVWNPYPINSSIANIRPPVNVSAFVNGTDLTIYFTFVNMTSFIPVAETFAAWTGQSTGRFAFTDFTSNGTSWIWGNTTYTWWVNATSSGSWDNATYYYNTTQYASGANARMDVNNNGVVNSIDLSFDWAHRTSSYSYNHLYDVNNNGVVNSIDLSFIWANRS